MRRRTISTRIVSRAESLASFLADGPLRNRPTDGHVRACGSENPEPKRKENHRIVLWSRCRARGSLVRPLDLAVPCAVHRRVLDSLQAPNA